MADITIFPRSLSIFIIIDIRNKFQHGCINIPGFGGRNTVVECDYLFLMKGGLK